MSCEPHNPSAVENLFSAWDTPEDRTKSWDCPNLSWQSSPLVLTSLLTKILKQYFSNPDNFTNPELRKMLESRTPEITQLDQWNAKNTGKLPKIAVEFVASAPDNRQFGDNNRTNYNIHNSTGEYYRVWNVQHRIDLVAQTKRETLLLGEAACRLFNHYQSVIADELAAHRFEVTQFQGAQLVGDDSSSRACWQASIGLTTLAPDRWYLTETAPRLKRILSNLQEQ